jgi:lysophospholipase L1-like esterase
VVLAGAVPALGAKDTTPGLPVMAGLGDSWTYGQGASDPAAGGYFALAHDALQAELDCLPAASGKARDGCKQLQVFNIARPAVAGLPGVTTDAVIEEQLPVMVPFLAARNGDANPRNDVEIVYLSAGGNDVSSPAINACLFGTPEQCEATINEVLTHVAGNLHVIVSSLREAAGPETPIVLVTYDSPVEFCFLGAFEGAAELGDFLLFQLDQVTRGVAAAYGATVATTLGQLGEGDWVGGPDCLHPNDSGHMKVADIAVAAAG